MNAPCFIEVLFHLLSDFHIQLDTALCNRLEPPVVGRHGAFLERPTTHE